MIAFFFQTKTCQKKKKRKSLENGGRSKTKTKKPRNVKQFPTKCSLPVRYKIYDEGLYVISVAVHVKYKFHFVIIFIIHVHNSSTFNVKNDICKEYTHIHTLMLL